VTGATGKFMYEDGMVTGSKLRINIDAEAGKVFYLTLWYSLKSASGPSGGGGSVDASALDSLKYFTRSSLGLNGHYPAVTTTATAYIPLGRIVEVMEAGVIASLSYTDQADSLVTITAGAGQRFYGKFKHFKASSGKYIIYK